MASPESPTKPISCPAATRWPVLSPRGNVVPTLQPPQRAALLDRRKAVEVVGLEKTYVSGGGWFQPTRSVQAAKQVSFDIFRGA